MKRKTLTICTHDDRLWERLQPLGKQWALQRCAHFSALAEHTGLIWLDADLPGAPKLEDAAWPAVLGDERLAIYASPRPGDEEGLRVFNSGFAGYVHLYAPMVQLVQVIKVVGQGNLWVGRSLLSRLLRKTSVALVRSGRNETEAWAMGLTEREREVAHRAALGESNQEIAEACGITERTVKAHLSAAFEKLGVHDRLQLSLKVHGIR